MLEPEKSKEKSVTTGQAATLSPANLPENPPLKTAPALAPGKTADITPVGDALAEPELTTSPGKGKGAFVSAGERIHKWGTYLSVDWIFNTMTGVSFAYWGKYSELGKKVWSGPITEGFTKLLRPIIKNPEQLKRSAGYGNMFMSIIAGGMFTIPPLMMLENNKVKTSITKFFDGMIYGKEKVEEDPKFQAAYEELQHSPKKDFSSGLWSRFAALSPLLAIVLIPTTKKVSNTLLFNHVEHASEVVATKAGFSATKLFKNVPPAQAKERWKFIHESVAMDFGLGIPYALLHAFFYNMFASRKHKAEKAEAATQANGAPADTAPATPETTVVSESVSVTEHDKNWVSTTRQTEKPKLTPRLKDGVAENFVGKLADKNTVEPQIV